MRMGTKALLKLTTALAALMVSQPASAEALSLELSPPTLEIGAGFAGRKVELSGTVEADLDIIVEVFGPEEGARFNLKGRVGPFWMNREKVELEHAPFLYLLLTPGGDEWRHGLTDRDIGLEQLEDSITVLPDSLDKDMIFDEFVKLKQSEGLFDEVHGGVHYDRSETGEKRFGASLFFPSGTAPGAYRVVVTGLEGGRVVAHGARPFQVAEAGVIKAVHDLASEHGLIYGVLCVLIALAVGGTIGLVFKGSGAH